MDTGAEQWPFSAADSKMEVDFGMLKSPWTAIPALSSLLAGSFVQGCSNSVSAQGCADAAEIPSCKTAARRFRRKGAASRAVIDSLSLSKVIVFILWN